MSALLESFRSSLLSLIVRSGRTAGLRRLVVVAGLLLTVGVWVSSLDAQAPNKIVQAVNAGQLQVLPNHHPQWANAANSIGVLPADEKLDHLTIVLSRSAEQQQALDQFEADLQDSASPNYHQWLTPAEFGARFGLSQQDLGAVKEWLQSQGLQVNWVAPGGTFIDFGGSAGNVSRAFHTSLQRYQVQGKERVSVASDPMIPAALAPAIKAIRGFYTIEEAPQHSMEVVESDGPLLTVSAQVHFITPADFTRIYDEQYDTAGAGQTIGIVGRARTDFADFDQFSSLTGYSVAHPTEVVPTAFGGVDPGPALTAPPPTGATFGDQGEATLDVTRASSVVMEAKVLLVVATQASGGIGVDAQYLVQSTPVPAQVMTISFGACESAAGNSGVAYWDTLFEQAAAEGISSFVSSGDAGAAGCDTNFAKPPASPKPISPNYICSSSYVTCVGGTEFADASNPSLYWSSSNSGGFESALGYIPEGAWNEPMSSATTPAPQAASSGGGVSAFIPTPAWQTGSGVPAARAGRYTPDVSFPASEHDGYFGCFAVGGASCVPDASGEFTFSAFSGTSAAAPSMAGVAALLNSYAGASHGNLNPELYKLALNAPSGFHDVTIASSGVSGCSLATPSMCNNSLPSSTGLTGGEQGYLVGIGYDPVTGLGSLDIQNFLLGYLGNLVAPTVTATPSPSTLTTAQDLTVAVTVAGGTGNVPPTGSVAASFVVSTGIYSTPAVTLNNGSASITVPSGTLPANSDLLTITYTPDGLGAATYKSASTTTSVTVNFASKVTPTATFSPSSYSINTTQPLFATFTVSGGNVNWVPTGSVVFSCGSYTSSPIQLANGYQYAVISPGVLPVGNCTLTGVYVPDPASASNYNGATGTATVTVTVPPLVNPSMNVTPSSTSIGNTWPLTVYTWVESTNGYPGPTGSVVLTSGKYNSGSIPLVASYATFNIPGGSLAAGTDTLTVTYTPDAASAGYYNSYSTSATVTVASTATLQLPVNISVYGSVYANADFTAYVGVLAGTGNPYPTGIVTLTSGSYTSAATVGANGSASFTVPANSLAADNDTLTATYTPDTASAVYYSTSTGTLLLTVNPALVPVFQLSGGSFTLPAGSTTQNALGIQVNSSGGFAGDIALTANLVSYPSGAIDLPTLSFGSTSPVSISAPVTQGAAILTVTTTAHSTASLHRPARPGAPFYSTSGATLACLLLIGIPVARRRWRSVLGMLLFLVALAGGVNACGGGGGSSSTTPPAQTGTTPGLYTITVTGTSGSLTATSTVLLTVQ